MKFNCPLTNKTDLGIFYKKLRIKKDLNRFTT